MWNGAFSPSLKKSADDESDLSDDDISFDPDNTDDPESMDSDQVTGTLSIMLGGKEYTWPDITYAQYLELQDSDSRLKWMNDNLDINYVGDWGWPWGRAHNVGYDKRSGTFFTY